MANVLLALNLPYAEIWIPLVAGMAVGGMCLAGIHLFARKGKYLPPPPPPNSAQKKSQDFDPFVQGSPTEQRKSHRRTGNPVEVFVAVGEETTPRCRAWVVDRSVGGLALTLNDEIKPETRLRILPVNATGVTPWTEVEVRCCRPIKEGFELGCQFVRQPQWSVLLMFG